MDDLFRGGEAFRARITDYLPENQVEPSDAYEARCKAAPYTNHCAGIVLFFAASVFAKRVQPSIASKDGHDGVAEPLPKEYGAFLEDCDGAGTDFATLLRQTFVDAQVSGAGWVLVDVPDVALDALASITRADADRAGVYSTRLRRVNPLCVTNWRDDDAGNLLWVVVADRVAELAEITDDAETLVDRWTCYYADGRIRTWTIALPPERKPSPEDEATEGPERMSRIGLPIVRLKLDAGTHTMGLLDEPARAVFRMEASLDWAHYRAAHPMLLLKARDPKEGLVIGTGYMQTIGVDEDMLWLGPPTEALAGIRDSLAAKVAQLYRVASQMARGIDETSAAALGRSGESKAADMSATNIVLSAFGEVCEEFAERVLNLVTASRGDRFEIHVQGLDSYNALDASALADSALTGQIVGIQSPTFRRELHYAIASQMLPGASEQTLSAIRDEIMGSAADDAEEPGATEQEATDGAALDAASADSVATVPHAKDQAANLNGAQVAAMVEIVVATAKGELPRDSAVAIIETSFAVDTTRAERIVGSAGRGFAAPKQPAPAMPFGGTQAPPQATETSPAA